MEFAFNPDFLRRVHGYQSLRRSVGAGYNSFGTRDSIGSAGQGIGGGVVVQRPMTRRSTGSIIKRVVLQPGTVEPRSNGFQGTNNFFLADFYYGK